MKRISVCVLITALACLAIASMAWAANDRFYTASISPNNVKPGADPISFNLIVTNNIISGPSHFLRQIVVTAPAGFTIAGSVTVQAPPASPLPWKAVVNGQTITVTAGSSNDASVTAGQSVTITVPAIVPAVACPGNNYTWGISANQVLGGGTGNSYLPTPGSPAPIVKVGCDRQTKLTLSVNPDSVITTDTGALVTLSSTLTTVDNGAPVANETIVFNVGGGDISCLGGPAITNAIGIATCSFTPQAGPNPLPAGVIDILAKFGGDASTSPKLGSSLGGPVKLNVNATGTGVAVTPISVPYSAVPQPVTLTATLTALGTGVAGKTLNFELGSTSVGSAVTDASGVATLSTTLPVLSPGDHLQYIKASFIGDAVYSAANGDGTVTVGKMGGDIWFTSLTATYDGSSHLPVAQTSPAGLSYTLSIAPKTDAGSYPVTATITDTAYAGSVSGTFTITPALPIIIVTGYSVDYDGNPHSIGSASATGLLGENLSGGLVVTSTHTPAGSYLDSWTFTGGGNYQSTGGSVLDVIKKASSSVTVTGGSWPYDGAAHAATGIAGTTAGSLAAPATVVISYTGSCSSAPTTVAQGTSCTATGTYAGDANHEGSSDSATLTITKGSQSIVFTSITVTATAGGAVSFSSGTPAICSVVGIGNGQATVTLLSGTWAQCSIKADQPGTDNYNAATQEIGVFSVTP